MDEKSESAAIREFESEAGMLKPTKFASTAFENIIIWKECEPLGTQKLSVDDIIEELKRTPEDIMKHIISIILSPYGHPKSGIEAFASVCDLPGYIIIYNSHHSREESKDHMMKLGTLRHEVGHIIDRKLGYDNKKFSHGAKWERARKLDARVGKVHSYPKNWLPGSAEKYSKENLEWGLEEDFADSIRCFTGNNIWNSMLKDNYPNRYKIIKELLYDD